MKSWQWNQQVGITVFLIFISVTFAILSPHFFTFGNLTNIVRQVAVTSVVAFGMTFVILTGGIDLSVGSIVAAAAIAAADVNVATGSLHLAILAGLLCGVIAGFINGVVIVSLRIPDFIATLAMMGIIRGTVMVYTQANPIYGFEEQFLFIGQGYLGSVPFPVVLGSLLFGMCYVALALTKFGRHVYAVGGNREVARLSGVNVPLIRIVVYSISGFAAAVTGIVLASRTAAAVPTAGTGYELDAIAAVVLGGTDLFGGRGSLAGTLLGLCVMGVLSNGLVLLGMNPFYVTIAKGVILIIAVSVSSRRH